MVPKTINRCLKRFIGMNWQDVYHQLKHTGWAYKVDVTYDAHRFSYGAVSTGNIFFLLKQDTDIVIEAVLIRL